MQIFSLMFQSTYLFKKTHFKMFILFLSVFAVEKEVIFGYNFKTPLYLDTEIWEKMENQILNTSIFFSNRLGPVMQEVQAKLATLEVDKKIDEK